MRRALTVGLCLTLLAGVGFAQPQGGRSVTKGKGETVIAGLVTCAGGRPTPVGRIRSTDGKIWTSPTETRFADGPKATDLHNSCLGITRSGIAEVDLSKVPVVEVDRDGQVVTGFIYADNYYELYVNGKLVAVDATPFTPFNSTVVKFRAKRPMTIAIKAVDWEENVGLGTESGGARAPHHPGDAGFIASFDNGVVSDRSWRVQTFYIAPLASPDLVVEKGNVHDTSALGRVYPDAASDAACALNCYAVRYPEPRDWASPAFDDRAWPQAFEYTEEQVGGGAPYRNFKDQLTRGGAKFIWSSNLVFDNVVLARKRIE